MVFIPSHQMTGNDREGSLEVSMGNCKRANIIWCGLVIVYLAASCLIAAVYDFRRINFLILAAFWFFSCWCMYQSEQIFSANHFDTQTGRPDQRRKMIVTGLVGLVLICLLMFWKESDNFLMISLYMIQFSYACWISCKVGLPIRIFCGIRKPGSLPALLLLIPAAFLMYFISSYVNILSMIFFEPQIGEEVIQSAGSLFPALISLALLPAFVEELLFRGLIFASISGKWKAILVSSACFALLHMNFNQMIYAFAMGIFLGWTVWKTGNVICSMILHMTFNGITVLNVFFAERFAGREAFAQSMVDPVNMRGILTDQAGRLNWQPLVFGLVPVLICIVFFVVIICLYCRLSLSSRQCHPDKSSISPQHSQEDKGTGFAEAEDSEAATSWKPDVCFALGCLICLVYAFLIERG